jgi:transposase
VTLFCGIDWAETHRDVAIIGSDGQLVAKKRIPDNPAGFAQLVELLAEAGDSTEAPVPVAIETPRGLLVASLRVTGRPVSAINPLALARYRQRHSVARAKSDHADAMTLANILRVDAHLPADSELCQAVAVLARAHQHAIWARTKAHHQLRSLLREFYPTFLAVFTGRFTLGIASPEARAVLAIAPTPAAAAKLALNRITAALRRAGRSRGITETAAEIKAELRKPQLHQPLLVETAMGKHTLALLAALDTACTNVDELGQASAELFQTHPDYAVITSFPGLAHSTGARVLAEIGDDRVRFADARSLKAYAGSDPSPVHLADPCRSPIVISRTTDSPTSVGCGPLRPPPTVSLLASTTASGGNTGTVMPPPTAICSTSSSASSITASNTTSDSTGARLFRCRSVMRPSGHYSSPRPTLTGDELTAIKQTTLGLMPIPWSGGDRLVSRHRHLVRSAGQTSRSPVFGGHPIR